MKRNRQAGQALVLASFGLTVFMLAAGLAIDMGYLRYQKRRMQTAADSAAIAGAGELTNGTSTPSAAALADASANGFVDTSLGGTATVTPTIVNCPNGTVDGCVQVVISQNQPTFFARVAGFNSAAVAATATAYLGPGPGCMYAGTGGITANGAMDTEASYCAIMTDGPLTLASASHHMNAEGIGYAQTETIGSQFISPAPQQIVPPPDPLAYLQNEAPPAGAGTCTTVSTGFSCAPGSYPNGIKITGAMGNVTVDSGSGPVSSTNLNVSFLPGAYALGGNGLTITGSGVINGMVTGYGVTFYASGNASLQINAGADYTSCTTPPYIPYVGEQVQFSAPTSGQYAGILYIQTPTDPAIASVTLSNGDGMLGAGQWGNCTNYFVANSGDTSGASYMWGAIYAPGSTLNLNGIGLANGSPTGCSNLPRFTVIDANTINLTNNINIGVNDCVSPPAQVSATQAIPDPIKDAVLVR